MRIGKLQLLALLLGAVVLGGMATVTAQEAPDEPREQGAKARMHRGGHGLARHALRTEAVVPGDEEGTFRTIRRDSGVIESISGSTLRIEEADGHIAQVSVSDDSTIRRDGQEASLDDLEVGDHVMAVQVDDGDGFVTKGVRAISAERYEELEQRREACREDPDECRGQRRSRRGGGRARFAPSADVMQTVDA